MNESPGHRLRLGMLVVAFFFGALAPALASAAQTGRSVLIEEIQQELQRTLSAQEAQACHAAADESLEAFGKERARLIETIASATGLAQGVVDAMLPEAGLIRNDVEPTLIRELSVALNRPLNAQEKHRIIRASHDHAEAFRRIKMRYLERLSDLTGLSYERLDRIFPEAAS